MGGESYIAETLRDTLSIEQPGRCLMKVGLEVRVLKGISNVKPMPNQRNCQMWMFDDPATEPIMVGNDLVCARKRIGQSQLREDLE
jgi:hypothetical protein